MTLRERVALPGGLLEVEFASPQRYRLRYGNLVEYADAVRWVQGRRLAYVFRSVEQLRYDFEKDVEAAGGRLA